MKRSQGFSLIELLIVIVIIGLIAAIAIPNLLAARRAANEGSAVSALRTLHGANVSYAATTGLGRYAGTPSTVGTSSLEALMNDGLIDSVLGLGEKSGFAFVGDWTESSTMETNSFYFSANPATPSGMLMTGSKRFGVATDGVIRVDATAADLGVRFDATTILTAQPFDN
jgi:type IV pilus assembly protein PilA